MSCDQRLTGADEPMPEDPCARSEQRGGRVVPCNGLVCGSCDAPVLYADGLSLELGRGAALPSAYASRDPLEFLRASHWDAAARLYACRCSALRIDHVTDTGRLDRYDIDHWRCEGHPHRRPRPQLLPLAEVLPRATARHLREGGWLVLGDRALEGAGDGSARSWPFDSGEPSQVGADALTTLLSRVATNRPRWTSRQVALPSFPTPPLFGCFIAGIKHGDLDFESYEGAVAEPALLVQRLRERSRRLPPPDSLVHVVGPGLLTRAGYLSFDAHPA
jgi:hypothetical protein